MVCVDSIIYNGTGVIGELLCATTNNITGNLFFTLLVLLMFFMVLMLAFRIPIEFQTFIILPFMFGLMAYTQEFLSIGGVILIFIAALVARSWSRF